MATKKFIIEVEEGTTKCNKCPLYGSKYCKSGAKIDDFKSEINCYTHNLATLKIKEYEDNTRDTSTTNRD